jgi:hypothetical protein
LTPAERQGIDNGIWACVKCAKLIDADDSRFTVDELRRYKREAEHEAARLVGRPTSRQSQVAALLSRQLRDQRQQLCGPIIAAIDEQVEYIPHWEMVASNRSYLGQIFAPFYRPVTSKKLAALSDTISQASASAAAAVSSAIDLLRRFEATLLEIKQRARDDAQRHGMAKDFGDEYFAAVAGVSGWLTEAKRSLMRARDELRAHVGDDVGA